MSVNLYLKKEVRQHQSFKSVPYEKGNGESLSFMGSIVLQDKGNLYITGTPEDDLNEELKPFIKSVSLYEHIPTLFDRERGMYKIQGASGTLEWVDQGKGKSTYFIKINADTFDAAVDLFRKIKAGTILPVESYDVPQGGKSREELEAELARLTKEVSDLKKAAADAEINRAKVKAAYKFAADLDVAGTWPFCIKSNVASDLNLALNDGPVTG